MRFRMNYDVDYSNLKVRCPHCNTKQFLSVVSTIEEIDLSPASRYFAILGPLKRHKYYIVCNCCGWTKPHHDEDGTITIDKVKQGGVNYVGKSC